MAIKSLLQLLKQRDILHLQIHVILFGVSDGDSEGIYSLRAQLPGGEQLPQETIIAFEDAQLAGGQTLHDCYQVLRGSAVAWEGESHACPCVICNRHWEAREVICSRPAAIAEAAAVPRDRYCTTATVVPSLPQ